MLPGIIREEDPIFFYGFTRTHCARNDCGRRHSPPPLAVGRGRGWGASPNPQRCESPRPHLRYSQAPRYSSRAMHAGQFGRGHAWSAQGRCRERDQLTKTTLRMLGKDALPTVAAMSPAEVAGVRAQSGISQAVLAAFLNVAVGTVSQWERGERLPTGAALKLLHIVKRVGAVDAVIARLDRPNRHSRALVIKLQRSGILGPAFAGVTAESIGPPPVCRADWSYCTPSRRGGHRPPVAHHRFRCRPGRRGRPIARRAPERKPTKRIENQPAPAATPRVENVVPVPEIPPKCCHPEASRAGGRPSFGHSLLPEIISRGAKRLRRGEFF
jgi:putative transcriptional regulator